MLKLVLPEADSDDAQSRWESWASSGTEVCAPTLLTFEATTGIRKAVHRALISEASGAAALIAYLALEESILLISPDGLHRRAWELAGRYRQPRMYDAYYVALAESLGCTLWTADERLRRAMPGLADFIDTGR
jgi:predicted nucleic acid-binding protein